MSNEAVAALKRTGTTIGLDIGGTKVLGIVLDADGNIVAEHREPTRVDGLEPLVDVCASIVATLPAADVPIGVGAAGLVDDGGWLRYAPNLPGLRDAPLQDALAQATGCRVRVDNDANVAALGEVTYGAAAGSSDAVLVTLGTGIGGGIILDGAIFHGAHGFAGEIGHVTVDLDSTLLCACGERGHWETIGSGTALGRMARAHPDLNVETGEELGRLAAAGDPVAVGVITDYADNVALGLVGLANQFDPECLVLAGGVVELGELLFVPLREAFARRLQGSEYRPEIPILPAQLGEHAGAVGAAVLARELV